MFTLKSLVDDAALELRVLVADSPGALEDPVVWVHNTELPDPSTYLRKGELVLTNGLWADQVTPAEFVANVRRAGAVGIVFGLRPDTLATPPGLIDS